MAATIRTSGLPADFRPQPHVQAFADAVQAEFGITSFGTYAGHGSATPRRPDLALDVFVTKAQGDRLAKWATSPAIYAKYSIDYHIWWHRIWNPEVSPDWRTQSDKGNPTANHEDHNHFSFLAATNNPEEPSDMTPDQEKKLDTLTGNVQGFYNDFIKRDDATNKRLEAIEKKLAAGGGGTAPNYEGTLTLTPKT